MSSKAFVELVFRIIIRTSSPACTSCRVTWEPTKPLAPMTSFFTVALAVGGSEHVGSVFSGHERPRVGVGTAVFESALHGQQCTHGWADERAHRFQQVAAASQRGDGPIDGLGPVVLLIFEQRLGFRGVEPAGERPATVIARVTG